MKFPLRLTLDLWRDRFFLAANGNGAARIFHLPAALLPALHEQGVEPSTDCEPHTAADSLRIASKTCAPVLWIGGSEPLDHAEVGRVAFALNARGRNVFLHTDGQHLRRRIHEFRPDPRLFLTVELAGRAAFHDRAVGKQGTFERVVEGICAAKLSGFYVCAHVSVTDRTEPCETGELFEFLDRYDVDGFIVSSGGTRPGSTPSAYREKLEELRRLVRSSRWEKFSALLEASYLARGEREAVSTVAPAAAREVEREAVEETV